MLISQKYKELNEELHARNPRYGRSGSKYAENIIAICEQFSTKDLLDYGCGKSTLAENLPFNIKQYDPAIEKYSKLPEPSDVVVCTDVMEHIEPEFLDDVLNHIKELTKKACFMVISTIPAKKTLSDGRNAHISLHDKVWWIDKLNQYFDINNVVEAGGDIYVLLERRKNNA
jgi:2-polyprenyl-3-methyl-5-hydroxy-6-metoxy-1,4-benzoquinol methylase